MSHVHNLGGNSNVTAEYQEYLDRLAAERRRLRNRQGGRQLEAKSFDSAIESDPESEENDDDPSDGESDREAEEPPSEDPEGQRGFSTKA
jgi:hypothetical protein